MAKLFILSAVAVLAATSPAHAQSVSDGGFDTLTLAPGSYAYHPAGVSGLTFFGAAGLQASSNAWGFGAVADGNQSAFIQGDGWFAQAVTGLNIGGSYTVSFFDSFRRVTELYSANTYSVSFDGQLLGTFAPASNSFSLVTTGPFIASATEGVLTFRGLPSDGLDRAVGIDAVSVFAVRVDVDQAAAVPEPAAWALMLFGFGAMGGALRRRATGATSFRFA
jgi:hypothetical protein